MKNSPLHIAIDGNEANIKKRVGSNVYAFELLSALAKLLDAQERVSVTVLLSRPPIEELPLPSSNWRYEVFGPATLWSQYALPHHLFAHRDKFDLLFTPGHYAPRFCPIPYISSVMDTAYLEFPDHFTKFDLLQLKKWTAFSVKRAKKVIAISQATKAQVVKQYHRKPSDVIVAHPSHTSFNRAIPQGRAEKIRASLGVSKSYFLYVGTIQPRKNIELLVDEFETFLRMVSSQSLTDKRLKKRGAENKSPQLVIAGKPGWLSLPIIKKIEESRASSSIIQTGYVNEEQKHVLLEGAVATLLLGSYEGFGLPPLESMAVGTPVIVADEQSLPEVVGEAGYIVDVKTPGATARAMLTTYTLNAKQRAQLRKNMRTQSGKFSWETSAKTVLETIIKTAESA